MEEDCVSFVRTFTPAYMYALIGDDASESFKSVNGESLNEWISSNSGLCVIEAIDLSFSKSYSRESIYDFGKLTLDNTVGDAIAKYEPILRFASDHDNCGDTSMVIIVCADNRLTVCHLFDELRFISERNAVSEGELTPLVSVMFKYKRYEKRVM